MTTYIDPIETDDAEMTQMREIWREEAREAQRLIREDRRPLSMIELYLVGEESV